jgi:hypothetical protein
MLCCSTLPLDAVKNVGLPTHGQRTEHIRVCVCDQERERDQEREKLR